jgi:hypothetical protein
MLPATTAYASLLHVMSDLIGATISSTRWYAAASPLLEQPPGG